MSDSLFAERACLFVGCLFPVFGLLRGAQVTQPRRGTTVLASPPVSALLRQLGIPYLDVTIDEKGTARVRKHHSNMRRSSPLDSPVSNSLAGRGKLFGQGPVHFKTQFRLVQGLGTPAADSGELCQASVQLLLRAGLNHGVGDSSSGGAALHPQRRRSQGIQSSLPACARRRARLFPAAPDAGVGRITRSNAGRNRARMLSSRWPIRPSTSSISVRNWSADLVMRSVRVLATSGFPAR